MGQYFIQSQFNNWKNINGLNNKEAARRLGVSYSFLHHVMRYKVPCPERLALNLSREMGIDSELILISFGKFPEKLIETARTYPHLVKKIIAMI